jgi:hypothetical protein
MKNLILLSCLLKIVFVSSQNLSNLDAKYGINKFKLESNFELYKKDLEYKGESNGLKLYYFKNLKSIKILDKDLTELSFTFYKNKLHSISIVLKTFDNIEQREVLKKLENLFGRASEGDTESTDFNYEWAYLWKTKKAYLGYNKMSCKSEFKPCVTNIYMISLKLQQQKENDSF